MTYLFHLCDLVSHFLVEVIIHLLLCVDLLHLVGQAACHGDDCLAHFWQFHGNVHGHDFHQFREDLHYAACLLMIPGPDHSRQLTADAGHELSDDGLFVVELGAVIDDIP